jgi:hypothetical protein
MNNNILDPVLKKVPETPYEHAKTMIHRYYYALPNNGSHDQGINNCGARYKEAIKCALIEVENIIVELEFIIIKMMEKGNELEGYIMEKINMYDAIQSELIKMESK